VFARRTWSAWGCAGYVLGVPSSLLLLDGMPIPASVAIGCLAAVTVHVASFLAPCRRFMDSGLSIRLIGSHPFPTGG